MKPDAHHAKAGFDSKHELHLRERDARFIYCIDDPNNTLHLKGYEGSKVSTNTEIVIERCHRGNCSKEEEIDN